MEQEEADRDKMADLEAKALDAKTELAIADALDEIRVRNARIDRAHTNKEEDVAEAIAQARSAQDLEDEEAAKRAFRTDTGERVARLVPEESDVAPEKTESPVPSFERTVVKKKKKNPPMSLGIKRKAK